MTIKHSTYQEIIALLKEYTSKEQIYLTNSGDAALYAALWIAKNKGFKRLLIPDQGGWLSYKKYGKQLGFEIIALKTNLGIINAKDLKQYGTDNKTVLLCTSLAGYYQQQPLKELITICKTQNIFVILDVNNLSDEINKQINPNIMVSSFGKWKVVNNYHGGCIASNEKFVFSQEIEDKIKPKNLDCGKLLLNLKKAPERLQMLQEKCFGIITDLKQQGIKIFNKDNKGIVVIAEDDEQIKNYCKEHNLEFVLCPREIRINEKAISIEVKRTED
ncbi:hypothetical protein HYY69_01555 [Candidatus Woesearchaeota archaeon]|nr:hypothetical protein [Candidatus Woesearchaeota archaeon]